MRASSTLDAASSPGSVLTIWAIAGSPVKASCSVTGSVIVGRVLSGVGVLTLPTLEPCLRMSFDAKHVTRFLKSAVRCQKPMILRSARKAMTTRCDCSVCLHQLEQLHQSKRLHHAVVAVAVVAAPVINRHHAD